MHQSNKQGMISTGGSGGGGGSAGMSKNNNNNQQQIIKQQLSQVAYGFMTAQPASANLTQQICKQIINQLNIIKPREIQPLQAPQADPIEAMTEFLQNKIMFQIINLSTIFQINR